MLTITNTASAIRSSAMQMLFARYVSGKITEESWERLMVVLDASPATAEEREAYATFFSDALDEADVKPAALPELKEMEDLLKEMRSC